MMQQLEAAKKEYESTSSETVRTSLERIFGKEAFQSSNDWNELFAQFCKEKNLTITHNVDECEGAPGLVYIPHANPKSPDQEHDNAWRMIRCIIFHNNKEKNWVADYRNSKQYRYFPVFKMTDAGLVFSSSYCEYWYSYSVAVVSAPFVSPTSEDAERIARKYLPIYKKYLQTQ